MLFIHFKPGLLATLRRLLLNFKFKVSLDDNSRPSFKKIKQMKDQILNVVHKIFPMLVEKKTSVCFIQ